MDCRSAYYPPRGKLGGESRFPRRRCAEAPVTEELLHAWTFERDTPLAGMAEIAQEELLPPDLEVRLLSSSGDVITVQANGAPALKPKALLYVRSLGAYEVLRREHWPEGHVLLVLSSWPKR
jgi:hypothetical protein